MLSVVERALLGVVERVGEVDARRCTGSLAGALCTPTVASLRAITPATCPDGGTATSVRRAAFGSGSDTLIHGQYRAPKPRWDFSSRQLLS